VSTLTTVGVPRLKGFLLMKGGVRMDTQESSSAPNFSRQKGVICARLARAKPQTLEDAYKVITASKFGKKISQEQLRPIVDHWWENKDKPRPRSAKRRKLRGRPGRPGRNRRAASAKQAASSVAFQRLQAMTYIAEKCPTAEDLEKLMEALGVLGGVKPAAKAMASLYQPN
jgi:hypothetical protein